jgi:succinyl-diaminopimelate desuccinylase
MSHINSVELAKSLIRCPSVTPHEQGAISALVEELAQLGFVCHRLSFNEEGYDPVENLYARLGTEGPVFCFAGHLDVVPPGNEAAWTYPPFEPTEKDGFLYGRGAEDMKAAIAAFTGAVSEFVSKAFRGSIAFMITCDEEGVAVNGTRKILDWLKKRNEKIDACIVGEPTNPTTLGEMIKIGRRGSMNCTLTVHGKQGHVAYPDLAENPVSPLVAMLHAIKGHRLDDGTEFFPPSNLEITTIDVGNPSTNVIPEKATAHFNIRFNNLHTGKSLEEWLRKTLSAIHVDYNLQVRVSGEAFLNPPGMLSDLVSGAVESVTSIKPVLSTTGGTSDARFIKDYCPVVEFGTTGLTAHKVDERVKIQDVYTLEKIYLEVLKRFFA